jgi:hypothetical protein
MCGVEQLPSVTSQEAEDVLLWSEKNTLIKLGHVKLIFGSSFVKPCMASKMFTTVNIVNVLGKLRARL